MGGPPSSHPTDQALQAYSQARLDEALSAEVDRHLVGCLECRDRVAAMSGDSFLGLPPEAHGATPAHGRAPSADGPHGRAQAARTETTLPPDLISHPDFEIIRELGRGGMGVVYLANNTLMGRKEVLKVVGSHLVARQGVLDRFLREIRSAAKLHHPNIVAAYSAMRLDEGVVLAMEYVEGEDLSKLVKSRGALPVTNACYFVYQAALGLQHAHERGMVHRDIKPANLILAREGKRAIVKVLDFGLAKATSEGQLDPGLTHEGQMLGTPDYIAPEQIVNAQKADIRADIYSLGCTLYYLLSGGAPFRATSLYELLQAHHSMDAPLLNLARPEVPTELAALVAKMMAKEPSRRFQTPGEVAQALTRFFKPGAVPSAGSSAEISRAEAPAPPAPEATQPATGLGVPSPATRPSRPKPAGAAHDELVEFQRTEPSPSAVGPVPAIRVEKDEDDGPARNWWPLIAGASVMGTVALGIVLYVATRPGEPKIEIAAVKPVPPPAVPPAVPDVQPDPAEPRRSSSRPRASKPAFTKAAGKFGPRPGQTKAKTKGGMRKGASEPEARAVAAPEERGPETKPPVEVAAVTPAPKPEPPAPAPVVVDFRRLRAFAGNLQVAAAPPGPFWPEMTPANASGWQFGDPSHITMQEKGLVVEAGKAGGNFLLTRDTSFRKGSISINLSASAGTEAFLVLRATEGPDGWRAVTSRIVEEGGRIRVGLQSHDFAVPERRGRRAAPSRGEFDPGKSIHMKFSIDAAAKAQVVSNGRLATTVVHGGPAGRAPSACSSARGASPSGVSWSRSDPAAPVG